MWWMRGFHEVRWSNSWLLWLRSLLLWLCWWHIGCGNKWNCKSRGMERWRPGLAPEPKGEYFIAAVVLGVKNDKSYTKNRWNICRSWGGTCSFFLSRVWDKEKYNSESSRGIKRQTFGIRAPMLYHWATETMMSKGFTRCIWHTRPVYSYNKQSEQNQMETRWRQDGKVVRSTALTYDWPLSCPAKTAAEWGTRRHFFFFR